MPLCSSDWEARAPQAGPANASRAVVDTVEESGADEEMLGKVSRQVLGRRRRRVSPRQNPEEDQWAVADVERVVLDKPHPHIEVGELAKPVVIAAECAKAGAPDKGASGGTGSFHTRRSASSSHRGIGWTEQTRAVGSLKERQLRRRKWHRRRWRHSPDAYPGNRPDTAVCPAASSRPELMRAMYCPPLLPIDSLVTAAAPRLCEWRMNEMRGSANCSIIWGVASLEPSSAIRNSKSGNVWLRTLSMVRPRGHGCRRT